MSRYYHKLYVTIFSISRFCKKKKKKLHKECNFQKSSPYKLLCIVFVISVKHNDYTWHLGLFTIICHGRFSI